MTAFATIIKDADREEAKEEAADIEVGATDNKEKRYAE